MSLNHVPFARLVRNYLALSRRKEDASRYYDEITARLGELHLIDEKFQLDGKIYAVDEKSRRIFESTNVIFSPEEIDTYCQRIAIYCPDSLAFEPSPELDQALGYPMDQLDRLTTRAT